MRMREGRNNKKVIWWSFLLLFEGGINVRKGRDGLCYFVKRRGWFVWMCGGGV